MSSSSSPTSSLGVAQKFMSEYWNQTPKKLKIVDAYLTYILLTGIFQFLYCCLVGTFPFNSFLSGFISTVASFVLAGMYDSDTSTDLNGLQLNFSLQYAEPWFVFALYSLLVCLRIQVNPENKSLFSGISEERAFADFIFAHLLLHLVVMNFIG